MDLGRDREGTRGGGWGWRGLGFDGGLEVIEGELERGLDVEAHGIGGGDAVADFEGGEDGGVLFAGEAEADEVVDAAVGEEDAGLDVAFFDGASEGRVTCAEEDGLVEGVVGVEELVEVLALEFIAVAVACGVVVVFHDAEVFAEEFEVAWGEAFGGFEGGEGFDGFADFVEFACGVLVEGADDGAEARDEVDEAFGSELGDGLADGGGGDAELFGEEFVVEA